MPRIGPVAEDWREDKVFIVQVEERDADKRDC
jgi:hypothetical protein